ncbi:MAG: RluA family pseudouridine synthase [Spirochaetales bacterium]|nr:RluA family pseudouridine synthase [Spirochaetales bacterium]
MKKATNVFTAGENDDGKRIDRVLLQAFPQLTRGNIFRALRKGLITLNGKKCTPETRVHAHDSILVFFSINKPGSTASSSNGDDIKVPLRELCNMIIYEDEHIIAFNKPRGLVVHGHGSLEYQVRFLWAERNDHSLSFHPGPIHRLDRNTTGLQLFSASIHGARMFTRLFRERKIQKIYIGVMDNLLKHDAVWEDVLVRNPAARITGNSKTSKGKTSITKVFPVISADNHTLALFLPRTGRTHQIRSQAAIHGFPLTGDIKYGGSRRFPWYLLHAGQLTVVDPQYPFGVLTAPMPAESEKLLKNIFGEKSIALLDKTIKNLNK